MDLELQEPQGPVVRGRRTFTKEQLRARHCVQVKESEKRNPGSHRRSVKAVAARHRDELQAYKMERGCVECGYREHPSALDFDHLPGTVKLFGIMGQGRYKSDEQIWAEVAKCEVVCANCHRVRTAERGH